MIDDEESQHNIKHVEGYNNIQNNIQMGLKLLLSLSIETNS